MNLLPSGRRPLRVLHLEDNLNDRSLVLETLRAADYACEYLWADNRAEFERALTEREYDLIISDYTLPSYDGAQALAAARRLLPAVPFIFLSGTIGEERAVESLKNGATDYVLKGGMQRFVPAVRRAIRESEEKVRLQAAQIALRRSEERFREMAENIREVFWTAAPDGRHLLYVSAAYEHVWKRTVTDALARPTSWLDVVLPEDQPILDQALAGLRQGTECTVEFRISWPNGSRRWLGFHGYPVQDILLGGVERIVGVAIDITEAKAADLRLEDERNLLRTILDNLPDLIYARDRQSRHLLNNRANLATLGVAHDADTFGKTDFDFYPEEMARSFLRDNEEVFRTGQPLINREEIGLNSSGEKQWQLTTKVPLRDATGNIIGLVGIGRDITEIKRASEKIHAQARMLDQARDAIVMTDMANRVAYWNVGSEKILGWSSKEAMERNLDDLLSGSDVTALTAARQAVVERGAWQGELQIKDRTGRAVVLDAQGTLVRDHTGAPHGHLFIGNDVTDRRKFEAQMLRAQRMESIGTLASGIAHDLNNVLAPIVMSIALLKIKTPGNDDVHRMLDQLAANAQRGAHLVQQVLAFGRGSESERIPLQAKHVVREVEQIVSDTFPKNIDFELTFTAEPWVIMGDPTQFHQILLNLCVNARDAMPNGGRLHVHLENMMLDHGFFGLDAAAGPGPYLVISVADTGTGIPPAIREKIFDPFFTTKEVGKGTGLGLSTTQAIVKSHGGFINLYSEEGRGTTFKIYLPANPGAQRSEGAAAEPPSLPRGDNELILVVDDELPIRELTQNTLERFGYRVLLAADGTQAVAQYALHRTEIAAVVTDMTMPIMDGPATILALRSINPDVKIIGSSGQEAETSRGLVKAVGLGIEHFVSKPYSAEVLLRTLRRVLGKPSHPPWH